MDGTGRTRMNLERNKMVTVGEEGVGQTEININRMIREESS